MGGDVFLRAFACVAVEPVQALSERPGQACQPAFHGVEHLQIADHHPHDGGEVGAGPVTMDKRFAGADRSIGRYQPPYRRVENLDLAQQVRFPCAEDLPLAILDDHQLAVAQLAELAQHAFAQQRSGHAVDVQAVSLDR